MRGLLRELAKLRADAEKAPETRYRQGYLDALAEVIEIVEERIELEEA